MKAMDVYKKLLEVEKVTNKAQLEIALYWLENSKPEEIEFARDVILYIADYELRKFIHILNDVKISKLINSDVLIRSLELFDSKIKTRRKAESYGYSIDRIITFMNEDFDFDKNEVSYGIRKKDLSYYISGDGFTADNLADAIQQLEVALGGGIDLSDPEQLEMYRSGFAQEIIIGDSEE